MEQVVLLHLTRPFPHDVLGKRVWLCQTSGLNSCTKCLSNASITVHSIFVLRNPLPNMWWEVMVSLEEALELVASSAMVAHYNQWCVFVSTMVAHYN